MTELFKLSPSDRRFRWIEIQFVLWQMAVEHFNETGDRKWALAAGGIAAVLRPLLEAEPE